MRQNTKLNLMKNLDHVAAFHTVVQSIKVRAASLANIVSWILAVCAYLYDLISKYNVLPYTLPDLMLVYHNFQKTFQ